MKHFIILMAFAVMLGMLPVPVAAEHGGKHVFVKINGLVCDFCARSMEKVFGKKEAVSGVTVNLDSKIVTIDLKNGAVLDDAEITKGITDAGYTVVEMTRDK